LRTKNWKLVEALQDAERRRGPASKMTTTTTATATMIGSEKVEQQQKLLASSAEKPVDVGKIVLEEQNRTKDLLNGATDSGSEDEQQALALRNEQLQKTVDQYKTIIADTENMLKNLEAKVIEQDIHWRSVVQAKEKELTLLKSAGSVVQ
uniref:Uncharacterized protein n=1 Tax=Anopheles atroparvus TaxID=41427 RepID=A0A182JAX0_ANOAO